MTTSDQKQAPVSPLSSHTHETDDMTIQFASAELQDILMDTVHMGRLDVTGLTQNDDGDGEPRRQGPRHVTIEDPEAIQRFKDALEAAGADTTEGVVHKIEHLNINLADLGLPDGDQNHAAKLRDPEYASAMLDQLWPVPGRFATADPSDSVIREFHTECNLLQTEIILNTIEELPDEDKTTLHSLLLAVTMTPDEPYEASPEQKARIQAINERIEQQTERAKKDDPERPADDEDMRRSTIYCTVSYLRASAECARRMQQRMHEDDGHSAPAIRQVILDVVAATRPMIQYLNTAEENEYEDAVRRGKEAIAQLSEIYEAEFREFNDNLPITVMPGLQARVTESTLKLARQVPVDVAGITIAVIKEPDHQGFKKLNPDRMKDVDRHLRAHPNDDVLLTNTVAGYHHEGRKYLQMLHEPYTRGYPAQRAWSDSVAVRNLARHHNPRTKRRIREDAETTMHAARQNVHDMDAERTQSIVDACRATGMSDTAAREVIESLVTFHPDLTQRLAALTDLNIPLPTRRHVRRIVSACRSAGVDEHDIARMLTEIGWDNMKSAGVRRHQATTQQFRSVSQAVQQAYSDQEAAEEAGERAADVMAEWLQ